MRYAVYVEGRSEMLFVADVLQKYSNYDPVQCGFLCVNLNADNYVRLTNPRMGDVNSANYYQIVNVNNDNFVISKLNKDIPGLLANGFDVILGLKDVYGDAYKRLLNNQRIIDRERIEHMHTVQKSNINSQGGDCRLHFAIMEYEAWMLALIENYVTNKGQAIAEICQQISVDVTICDPENEVYHPFPLAKKIFQVCGEDYNKHGGESFTFLSPLTVEDYERLRHSGKCASFSKFLDSLLGGVAPQLP